MSAVAQTIFCTGDHDRRAKMASLLKSAPGRANAIWMAQILLSWRSGESALPAFLGVKAGEFKALLGHYFPEERVADWRMPLAELERSRIPEFDDLVEHLVMGRAGLSESELLIAKIVAAACMGQDHLWQDLGVWSRQDLSHLLQYNFPGVAQKNTKDMKWKKFLYKQLCESTGVYVCRAPSCEVCVDYAVCFGPEE